MVFRPCSIFTFDKIKTIGMIYKTTRKKVFSRKKTYLRLHTGMMRTCSKT